MHVLVRMSRVGVPYQVMSVCGRGGLMRLALALACLTASFATGAAAMASGRALRSPALESAYIPRPEAVVSVSPSPPAPVPVGTKVCASGAGSYMPRGDSFIRAEVSWGDGAAARLARLRHRVCHVFVRPGRWTIRLRVTALARVSGARRRRVTVKSKVTVRVRARKRLVLSVAPGLDMLDLDGFGDPYATLGGVFSPVMSGDGNHVAWGFNNPDGDVGFVWRNLLTGETIVQDGIDAPFDMSADGRYVAYAKASEFASDGYIEAEEVFLWDTETGRQVSIDRKTPKDTSDDGSTDGVSVSADGRFVAFDSTSQALAPAGETLCTPLVTPGDCNEAAGYVYLYDRASKSLVPVPRQAMFGGQPALSDPVISGNGEVVAFHDSLDTDVWYTQTGVVRRINESDFPCQTDSQSLALSSDGTTLASNCSGSVGVIKLGGPAGPDTVEWTYTFPNPNGYDSSAALSSDGSVMALLGSPGPAGWGLWPLWRVELPSGAMSLLPAPGDIPGLRPDPKLQIGMGDDRVTISTNGDQITAAACSIEAPTGGGQTCPSRTDVFRWTASNP